MKKRFPDNPDATVWPDGKIMLEITKDRIVTSHFMEMYKDTEVNLAVMLMVVKLKGGQILHIRFVEHDMKYSTQTWFDRLREMEPKDKITLALIDGADMVQELRGHYYRLYEGEFIASATNK